MRRHGFVRLAMGIALAVGTLAATLSLSGCGSPAAAPLEGTSWKLTGWSVSSIDPASVTITATFKDGRIGGNSGVNSYGGPYSTGSEGTLTIGALVSTLMAGPEPAMRAEQAYTQLLSQVGSFKVTATTLTLYDKNGNESLIFSRASDK